MVEAVSAEITADRVSKTPTPGTFAKKKLGSPLGSETEFFLFQLTLLNTRNALKVTHLLGCFFSPKSIQVLPV